MSYRKILVPLFGTANDRAALHAALGLAGEFGCHVEGLFVRIDPLQVPQFGYLGGDISGYSAKYFIEAAIRAADEAQNIASHSFNTAVKQFGVKETDQPGARREATAELKIVHGDFAERIEQESRLSDLVVCSATGDDLAVERSREAFEGALLSGSRPILFVPANDTASSHRIAIAYDGSAAAAHAVTAALPFFSGAKELHAFQVTSERKPPQGLPELKAYLALRGIAVVEHIVDPGHHSTAQALLAAVHAAHCDMLILGGYGHSRVREFVLGGVTRHVLRQSSPLTILMAH